MATILRRPPHRVVIFSNDHRPAHVHVIRGKGKGEATAVFVLHCPEGPPELREVYGDMKLDEVNKIFDWLTTEIGAMCVKWSEIHGDF